MINVSNSRPEVAIFNSAGPVQAIAIGPTSAVGTTGEFGRIVGTDFVRGGDQNDVLRLLDEVLYGDGVDGVELITIDNDTATLGLFNVDGVRDIAIVDGIDNVIDALALGFADAGNNRQEFAFFDIGAGDDALILNTSAVGTTGEFARIVGSDFRVGGSEYDLLRTLSEVFYGNGISGVTVNTIDDDSVTLELTNARGVTDTIAFDEVGAAIGAITLGFVDAGNDRREFGYFNVGEDESFLFINSGAVGTTGEFGRIVGDSLDRGDLLGLFGEVLEGDGIDGVVLNTLDDDSFTLELTTAGGVRDTILIDNAASYLAELYTHYSVIA